MADFSLPDFTLSSDFVARLNYSTTLRYEQLCLVYRVPPLPIHLRPSLASPAPALQEVKMQRNALGMESLVWAPRGIWMVLAACVALRSAVLWARPRLALFRHLRPAPSSPLPARIPPPRRQGDPVLWRELEMLWAARLTVLLYLVYGIALAVLGKYLFTIFSDVRGYRKTLNTAPDLITVPLSSAFA